MRLRSVGPGRLKSYARAGLWPVLLRPPAHKHALGLALQPAARPSALGSRHAPRGGIGSWRQSAAGFPPVIGRASPLMSIFIGSTPPALRRALQQPIRAGVVGIEVLGLAKVIPLGQVQRGGSAGSWRLRLPIVALCSPIAYTAAETAHRHRQVTSSSFSRERSK